MSNLKSVEFEVSGQVQGVSFRYYTKRKARELGIVGWVKNMPKGLVAGVVQGPEDMIEHFKQWVHYEGSPSSRIDDVKFTETSINQLEFEEFLVQH